VFSIFQQIRFQSIVAVTAGGVLGKSRQIWVGPSPLYRYVRSQKEISVLTGSIRLNVEIAVIQTSAMGSVPAFRDSRRLFSLGDLICSAERPGSTEFGQERTLSGRLLPVELQR
jgi:hypothetical protein